MTIDKPKLPKGLSYVTKSSRLQELFEELTLDIDISVRYHVPKRGSDGVVIFDCLFWLPNPNVSYNRLYITVGTVESTRKEEVNALMEGFYLQFKKWLGLMCSQSYNSTLLKQDSYISANFTANELVIKSMPIINYLGV